MSSDEVLKSVVAETGYDADELLARANGPECKADLRARTKEAKDLGLCGVPTYLVFRRKVGDKEWKSFGDLVWGQDEFPVVEDLIAGVSVEGTAEVATRGRGVSSSKL